MFFLSPNESQVLANTELTLADLQSAINEFATQNNVTSDVFFELLFSDAIKYFLEEYYPVYNASNREAAEEHLYGHYYKITSTRPKKITFETGEQGQNYLRLQEDHLRDIYRFSAMNVIWEEILNAYFKHKLCAEPIIPISSDCLFSTADLKCTNGAFVKLPIKAILEKFLPIAATLLPTTMNNPVNQRAYSLPDAKLNYEQLVSAANAIAATYFIDTHFADVFEHVLCTILQVQLATKACFGDKEGNYADTKHSLRVELEFPLAEAQTFMANANALQENAVQHIAAEVPNESTMQIFDISYNFIADFVLPQMATVLQTNPELVKRCQEQYRMNCKDRSYAQFYSNYYSLPNKTTAGLRL